MKPSSRPAPGRLITPAALSTAVALGMVLALSALSTPPRFRERLTALDEAIGQVDRATRGRLDDRDLPAGAICSAPLAQEAGALRSAITSAAQSNKLALGSLEVAPDNPSHLGETLAPIRVRIEAQGGYEGAVAMLDSLSRLQPMLFADSVDLTSKTSSVTLNISGRVFCAG